MLSYCLKGRKNAKSKNTKFEISKNERIMLLWKCAVPDSKKSTFNKQQEGSGLLSSLNIKTLLSKIPLIGPLLHWYIKQVSTRYKMNETIKNLY